MGRQEELSETGMRTIDAMHKQRYSLAAIASEINRHRTTVSRYLKRGIGVKSRPRSGRPVKLSEHSKRQIWREASNNGSNCTKIRDELALDVSTRTVLRCVHQNPNLKFMKKMTRPQMTDQHKANRVDWCLKRLLWDEEWHHYVFTDEKKFNLDGPDGWAYYWHDLRKDQEVFSKRQLGGSSVMVWAGFGWNGKTPIYFMDGNINSVKYTTMLQDQATPHLPLCAESPVIFQQDNCSVHTSNLTKHWLNQHFDWDNQWPSKSPDLNPMENLWGILSRKVYPSCKQYRTVNELKVAIEAAWAEITMEMMQKLITSMTSRVIAVISVDGDSLNV
jgi:transposase